MFSFGKGKGLSVTCPVVAPAVHKPEQEPKQSELISHAGVTLGVGALMLQAKLTFHRACTVGVTLRALVHGCSALGTEDGFLVSLVRESAGLTRPMMSQFLCGRCKS